MWKLCPSFAKVLSKLCQRPPQKASIKVTSRLPCIGHLTWNLKYQDYDNRTNAWRITQLADRVHGGSSRHCMLGEIVVLLRDLLHRSATSALAPKYPQRNEKGTFQNGFFQKMLYEMYQATYMNISDVNKIYKIPGGGARSVPPGVSGLAHILCIHVHSLGYFV